VKDTNEEVSRQREVKIRREYVLVRKLNNPFGHYPRKKLINGVSWGLSFDPPKR